MYAASDPRSALNTPAARTNPAPTAYKGAEYARFYDAPPQEVVDGSQTYYARGQNLIVAHTRGKAGLVLSRTNQLDEYVVLLPNRNTPVEVRWNGEGITVDGYCIVVVPAGDSEVHLKGDGEVIRLLTTRADDLVAKCSNAESYIHSDPNVPPFQAWPDPVGGHKLRHYSLDVPPEPGRFGIIFRCSTIMVNFLPGSGPRDITKMSPHFHDDFEQYSLCVAGSYIHYLRWPWISDLNAWRPDDAELCAAPSVAVIPPPAIHTSRSIDPVKNVLVDIFSPPRADFSAKSGWVLNADEYPAPDTLAR
ncbi:hypothetical protein [Rhizobium sp. YS-1r]|uniref:5-deoxyglucuronate isomerase n=1 Tax=Neorhizobium phenanthreniclasticum TaxID=3157917 RepID=A0ABV0M7B2_9HYPH|nr:hypothetical protein [Rhizobium sp. YS-1r]KGE02070.1 hypothetical protein JL39_00595 [Rhizobium sp. YS-1r]